VSQTHWKKLTNPNYLGSWDFNKGEERVLTINNVVQEEVFNPGENAKKSCIVAYFKGNSKPMVLNKTNCKTLEALCKSKYIEDWAGHSIIVHTEKVKAFGKLEDALRILNKKPATNVQACICEDCNKPVTDFGGYSASQIVDKNLSRYGRTICAECSGKLKRQNEDGGNVNDTDSR